MDFMDGGKRKTSRKRSKGRRKKSRSRRKRASSRSRSRSASRHSYRTPLKYYTIVDSRGHDLGGRYCGLSALQAARKLHGNYFGNKNVINIRLRQTSPGPRKNYIYIFRVKRKLVPATPYIQDLTGRTQMYQKIAEFIDLISP